MKWFRKTVPCDGFDVEIVRSRRRTTVGITVREGRASVAVPQFAPYSQVAKLIQHKQYWIQEKLQEQRAHLKAARREYVSGERFAYLGRNYRLTVLKGKAHRASASLVQGRLVVSLPANAENPQVVVQAALIAWYKVRAEHRLGARTHHYAELLGVVPRAVRVRDFKSRWGSCHNSGEIKYNWRIIMAPAPVVDYLVVHELCHLHHPDHSRRFWQSVERQLSDYRQRRSWLKDHGWTLVV
ncbi:MAG: SprT family zinc-dependent metalloprotease [Pseudomonadota bacterium]|nr:SprT family zinc-dependent metalloprotease [Pseudomonadota bacterium]